MTRKLFTAMWILFAVFVVTWALSSLALDPENLGGRLGLYLLGILAFVAAIVLMIVGLVRRARERSAPERPAS